MRIEEMIELLEMATDDSADETVYMELARLLETDPGQVKELILLLAQSEQVSKFLTV